MSNSLDPNQAQHFVGPDLGPNCLQRLSADDMQVENFNINGYEHPFFFYQSWP